MAFKQYVPSNLKGRRGNEFVRLHKGGIYISSTMAAKYRMGNFATARLYIDKQNGLIGFELCNDTASEERGIANVSYGTYKRADEAARSVNSTAFVRSALELGYKIGEAYLLVKVIDDPAEILVVKK